MFFDMLRHVKVQPCFYCTDVAYFFNMFLCMSCLFCMPLCCMFYLHVNIAKCYVVHINVVALHVCHMSVPCPVSCSEPVFVSCCLHLMFIRSFFCFCTGDQRNTFFFLYVLHCMHYRWMTITALLSYKIYEFPFIVLDAVYCVYFVYAC